MPDMKSIETELSVIENDASKILGLIIGAHEVTPGQEIPKADAQAQPELSFKVRSGTYLVVGLDIDAPFPSFNILSPILHWLQHDLKPEPAANGTSKLVSTSPVVADYAGPGPPPPSASHRYVFLLYKQPDGFDAKKFAPANGQKMGLWSRMRYDFEAFAKEVGLGPVVACNYFKSSSK